MAKRTPAIRVGIFDQIVSGGGVRRLTSDLLEEFSRQAGSSWHFHLMWPYFDSSDNYLVPPRLPHVSFERMQLVEQLDWRRRAGLHLQRFWPGKSRPSSMAGAVKIAREEEQMKARDGSGAGLRWLDQRQQNFDVIYISYPYLTLPRSVDWVPSIPIVTTLHDMAHEFTDAWGEVTSLLREEVKTWTEIADLIVFSSDSVRTQAERVYQIDRRKTRRIYLCPAPKKKTAQNAEKVLRRYGLEGGYIFTLGWAARHKRVQTIIEGFAQFRKDTNRDIPLVIAGPATKDLPTNDLFGLVPNRDVFALGYVEDDEVPALYQNASAVVTASVSEAGLNSMIFEALAHAKPVICSNIPVFVERLGCDEQLALMFDPHSPLSLATALARHFSDPAKAEARVRRGLKFASERTIAEVGRDYLAAFESVL